MKSASILSSATLSVRCLELGAAPGTGVSLGDEWRRDSAHLHGSHRACFTIPRPKRSMRLSPHFAFHHCRPSWSPHVGVHTPAFGVERRWGWMLAGIRLSPLYFPLSSLAMTAVLRHVKGFPLLQLLPPLRHAVIPSVAADPVLPTVNLDQQDR